MGTLTWHVARSAGIVAWAMLALSMFWGLALSTRTVHHRLVGEGVRTPRPNWMLDFHRFLGAAAIVLTAIHVLAIVADDFVSFGAVEVLVPLTSSYAPVAVAWGIVAMYLLAAVEVTSLLRRQLSKKAWRTTHYLSFPVFAMATIHGLTAGTERAAPVFRDVVFAVTAALAIVTAWRVAQLQPRRPPTREPERTAAA